MSLFILPERRLDFLLRRLAASALLLALLLALIRLVWYPGAHFQLNGVSKFVAILVGVTLVVGPGLTTLIYRRDKKGMKFDIAAILVVEILALMLAGATLYERRPVYLVFAIDRFDSVAAEDVTDHPFRYPELARQSDVGPSLVLARFPDATEERAALKYAILFEGAPDINVRPDQWYPYERHVPVVLAQGRDLAELRAAGEPWRSSVDRWLASVTGTDDDYLFLPVTGKARDGTMIVDRTTGVPVGLLAIDPWI